MFLFCFFCLFLKCLFMFIGGGDLDKHVALKVVFQYSFVVNGDLLASQRGCLCCVCVCVCVVGEGGVLFSSTVL